MTANCLSFPVLRGGFVPGPANLLWVVFLSAILSGAPALAEDYVEGKDYQRIQQPVATYHGNRIEVVEVFWYGCPHCRDFSPLIEKWEKSLPEDVAFELLPSTGGKAAKTHAAAFYTAKALDKLDALHQPLFDALARDRKPLNTEDALRDFFVEHGVDGTSFDRTFNSFGIKARVNSAFQRAVGYKSQYVPVLIVNGKYRVGASEAGSFERMLKVTDYLVEKERSAS